MRRLRTMALLWITPNFIPLQFSLYVKQNSWNILLFLQLFNYVALFYLPTPTTIFLFVKKKRFFKLAKFWVSISVRFPILFPQTNEKYFWTNIGKEKLQ